MKKTTLFTFLTVLPLLASAAPPGTFAELVGKFCTVLNWVYTAAIVVGVASVLLAAFKYLTARGDPEKVSEGHKALTYAIIGIAVAILAAGVPFVINSVLGGKPGDVKACSGQGG